MHNAQELLKDCRIGKTFWFIQYIAGQGPARVESVTIKSVELHADADQTQLVYEVFNSFTGMRERAKHPIGFFTAEDRGAFWSIEDAEYELQRRKQEYQTDPILIQRLNEENREINSES